MNGLINLYRNLNDALSFENSQINAFYSFTGVHLLPNNTVKYVQRTNVTDGIHLEDWTVYGVKSCSGEKIDITESFMVESIVNDDNGDEQIFWSLENVTTDFGYGLIYLEIHQSLGETFYSTPFYLTNEYAELTTQFHYKSKKIDKFQSLGFQCWFRQNNKQTELTNYYEISTKTTVTQTVKSNKTKKFQTELLGVDTLIYLSDILESAFLYVDNKRAYLFEAVQIPTLTSQENFGNFMFELSVNNNDVFSGDYVAPIIVLPIANDDSFDVPKTGTTNLYVLSNDSLGNEPTEITYLVHSGITQGTVAISTNKQFLIFTGSGTALDGQTCTYTITDSKGYTSQATVTINAKAITPPINAVANSVTLQSSGVQNIYPLANDELGVIPTTITEINTTGFTAGAIVISGDGQYLIFTPNGTGVTNQSITYKITDSTGAFSSATITITVNATSIVFSDFSSFSVSPFGGTIDEKEVSGTITVTGQSYTLKVNASIFTNNSTVVSSTATINGVNFYVERNNQSGTSLSSNSVTLAPGTYNYYLKVRGSGLGGSGSGQITVI